MSAPAPERQTRQTLTHEDYFRLEERDDWRYEYLAGEVFAMAGGSESHALIAANTLGALINALRQQPCRVYGSDMKLRIERIDKFCYPDLMVLCAPGCRTPRYVEAPTLIAEVLSKSTESYDRGLKFEHYRGIPELRYYLLLDQERPHAELFTRGSEPDRWVLSEANGMDGSLDLPDWNLRLPLADLYRDVALTPEIA